MLTADQILSGLHDLANAWQPLAIFWHLYFAALLLAILSPLKLSLRTTARLLALPVLSVSALAWRADNPFNGAIFGVLFVAMTIVASRFSREQSTNRSSGWPLLAGGLLFAFGWLYPHFLDAQSPLAYSYAAPTGILPCPTLSIIIGVTLLVDGLGSRAWCLALGGAGLFYGLFGALYLGVVIDWLLAVGAVAVVAQFVFRKHQISVQLYWIDNWF